tara:strand:+ start:282 stop:785 length:504 start_codon:yes stop_codon:yes gene_type:complete
MAKRKKRFMTPKAARRRTRKLKSQIAERRKKEFTYRGLTLDELQALPLFPPESDPDADCVLTYLPSRARRSLTRMNDANYSEMNQKFISRIEKTTGTIRTHRRDMVVLPSFVGKTIAIHNGSGFLPIDIKPEMIGHYFGEFAMTRKSVTHSGPGVGATKSSKHVALK